MGDTIRIPLAFRKEAWAEFHIEDIGNCGMMLFTTPRLYIIPTEDELISGIFKYPPEDSLYKLISDWVCSSGWQKIWYMTDRMDLPTEKYRGLLHVRGFVQYLKESKTGMVFDGPKTVNPNYNLPDDFHVIQGFTWVPPPVIEAQEEIEAAIGEQIFTPTKQKS